MGSGRATGTDLIEVLDRVLDKGIVVDAWTKFSIVGVDLLTLQARVVVASLETYSKYSNTLAEVALIGDPA
jgi:gas vesicle structural protein